MIFLGSLCDDDDDDDNTANGKGAARDSRKGPNDPQFAANSLPSPSAAFDSNIAGQTDGDRRTRHQALYVGEQTNSQQIAQKPAEVKDTFFRPAGLRLIKRNFPAAA